MLARRQRLTWRASMSSQKERKGSSAWVITAEGNRLKCAGEEKPAATEPAVVGSWRGPLGCGVSIEAEAEGGRWRLAAVVDTGELSLEKLDEKWKVKRAQVQKTEG